MIPTNTVVDTRRRAREACQGKVWLISRTHVRYVGADIYTYKNIYIHMYY